MMINSESSVCSVHDKAVFKILSQAIASQIQHMLKTSAKKNMQMAPLTDNTLITIYHPFYSQGIILENYQITLIKSEHFKVT